MIPQGRLKAARAAYDNEPTFNSFNEKFRAALEAAAAWDREHAAEIVTEAMVLGVAQLICAECGGCDKPIAAEPCRFCDGGGMKEVARRAIEAALREIGKCGG